MKQTNPTNERREQARELVSNAIKRRVGDGSVIHKPWELIDQIEAALSSRDAESRFMVHEPTHVVECNDSGCPVGATIIGWPHGLDTPGCMYYPTVASRDAEIREVLEGLRGIKGDPHCWCNPKFANIPACHTFECQATQALWSKLQPKEILT